MVEHQTKTDVLEQALLKHTQRGLRIPAFAKSAQRFAVAFEQALMRVMPVQQTQQQFIEIQTAKQRLAGNRRRRASRLGGSQCWKFATSTETHHQWLKGNKRSAQR